jgi:hypothetical protein
MLTTAGDIPVLRPTFLRHIALDYCEQLCGEPVLTLTGSVCVQSELNAMQFEHRFPGIFALSPA